MPQLAEPPAAAAAQAPLAIAKNPNRPGGYVLSTECVVPAPLEEVFDFFSRAENLERLTPPWLRFKILTPLPIEMRVGALIDYQITLKVVPMRWRTEITAWEPGRRFVDQQRRGPYRYWEHEHTFAEVEGGTRMGDRVEYAVPGGELVHRMVVRPDLERIFTYRLEQQRVLFG